jgi:prolyl-tRNA editing enzyme YbaK/EbsC (Cys-tRNA(Pro) deacylase)
MPSMITASGKIIETYALTQEVTTCEEAAKAKGIPLKNELKTLIFSTSKGLHALHVPGNRKASLRTVKNVLKVKEAYLAGKEKLQALSLAPGTVCPLIAPVWHLPHLVSQEVLELDFVSTNNGTKKGYIIFIPKLLLSAANLKVGKFALAYQEFKQRT